MPAASRRKAASHRASHVVFRTVDLADGRADTHIPTAGGPPAPRSHHSVCALKDPPAPPPKARALQRMKTGGLSLLMAQRTAAAGGGGRGDGSYGCTATSAVGTARSHAAFGPSRGIGDARQASWTVLVLGGRTGTAGDGLLGAEDAVHVLKLSEDGSVVRWIASIDYLRDAARKRLRRERVQAESRALIVAGHRNVRAAAL